jgi:hypothetical protein
MLYAGFRFSPVEKGNCHIRDIFCPPIFLMVVINRTNLPLIAQEGTHPRRGCQVKENSQN